MKCIIYSDEGSKFNWTMSDTLSPGQTLVTTLDVPCHLADDLYSEDSYVYDEAYALINDMALVCYRAHVLGQLGVRPAPQ